MFIVRGSVFLILLSMGFSAFAADNSSVHISQVSGAPSQPEKEATKETLLKEENLLSGQGPDYQTEVINNPRYSDYGRAQAAIKANEAAIPESGANAVAIKQDANAKTVNEEQLGHNIAVIHQEGTANNSTIVQTGKNNKAVQTQKGIKNDLSVTQNGNHNQSYEEQIGNYNHKKKIQNGIVTESEENN